MPAPSTHVPQIGRFLVQLERLERAQRPAVFLVDRIEATALGVMLRPPSGVQVVLPVDASATSIGEALRAGVPELRVPQIIEETPLSDEPIVQIQWAQLHYALGAYESGILADAGVRVLAVERHGSSATVQVLRGLDETLETYSIHLDRAIAIGLADPLAFAPSYGIVNGSLDQP